MRDDQGKILRTDLSRDDGGIIIIIVIITIVMKAARRVADGDDRNRFRPQSRTVLLNEK